MEKTGNIYKITNIVSGKVYIGQTIGLYSQRVSSHLSTLRNGVHRNPHLQNSYNKHGEECFTFELVGRYPMKSLDDVEKRMIAEQRMKKRCYNIQDGGVKNKGMSESTKKKLSSILKELHSENGEFRKTYLKHRAKKIIHLNSMKIYEGSYVAAKELNLDRQAIFQNVKGNNRYIRGVDGTLHQFNYYEEGEKYTYTPVHENVRTAIRSVVCLNTKEVFDSVKEASEAMGITNQTILRCCRKVRHYGGRTSSGEWLVWRFLEDYDEREEVPFNRKGKNFHRSRSVRCTTTGEVFGSITEACESYNLSSGNLTSTLKGNRKYCGKLNGIEPLYWEYA